MKNYLLPLVALTLLVTSCTKQSETPPPPELTPTVSGLPVVFHILYEDPMDIVQNPSTNMINSRLKHLNEYYAATRFPNAGSTPIDVEFSGALYDPSGKLLAEPGIHRVQYAGATDRDPSAFLNAKHPTGSANDQIFWDPHKYINIWVLGFSKNSLVTGISYMGVTTTLHPYPGLSNADYYALNSPDFMYGIALNNRFFITDGTGSQTLAHEMGHYLGLHHAFDANGACTKVNDSADDYCSDTPIYDRIAYDKLVNQYITAQPKTKFGELNRSNTTAAMVAEPKLPINSKASAEDLYYRTSCTGVKFRSNNIMDYYYSSLNVFTPEQRDRIVHMLKYGPLVPRTNSSKAFEGFENLEITDEIPTLIIME